MSESNRETSDQNDGPGEGITDDQLPDDLNPEKNPLARDPEDDPDGGGAAPGPAGSTEPGQPG